MKPATGVVMHPMIKPAMRRSWRDRGSLQFGLDPAHAVVLAPVDDPTARFLTLLDGTRGRGLLHQEAAALGIPPERADRLLASLADGGVLDDTDSAAQLADVIRRGDAPVERLRPDLASLSVVHPEPGAAAARMTARRAIRVQVRGAGRVGAAVAAVLAAAGVGQVDVADGGRVEPWDTAPCGISAAQVGERREAAARGAVRRAWPDPRPARPTARTGRAARGGGPDRVEPPLGLAVLAPRDGLGAYAPDRREAEALLAAGIPHLYAGVLEGVGVVGPLVVPGRTGCAGCLEAAATETDPAWPRILAQLRSGRPPGGQACDVALATLVAGLTATNSLAFLDWQASYPDHREDDAPVPPGAGARTEFSLTGLETRVFAVPPHAGCGCGAARRTTRATMAG